MVTAEQLSKWYGSVSALNDITISVPPGITGLLGPNGAGKSTLMKLVTGQWQPQQGHRHGAGRAGLGESVHLLAHREIGRAHV